MKNRKVSLMCTTGIFAALVFVVTAYLHIPTNNGYIHVGDGFIYLAACMLPWPYAMAVGAGGAFLADCLTGFAIWAPGSVIIKSLTALLFSRKGNKMIRPYNLLMLLPATVLCAGGYYLYDAILYGNFAAPLAGIPTNLVQSAASAILFVVVGHTFDKFHIKQKIIGNNQEV